MTVCLFPCRLYVHVASYYIHAYMYVTVIVLLFWRRGVYIASMVYSEETKILVTGEDILPIVEVSDSTSSSIGADFVWLANLACTWEHVQAMCDISDRYTSSPAVQFRNKLLHAVLDLQNALGITSLGLLHPVPYKDLHGAIVFVIIKYTMDVSGL